MRTVNATITKTNSGFNSSPKNSKFNLTQQKQQHLSLSSQSSPCFSLSRRLFVSYNKNSLNHNNNSEIFTTSFNYVQKTNFTSPNSSFFSTQSEPSPKDHNYTAGNYSENDLEQNKQENINLNSNSESNDKETLEASSTKTKYHEPNQHESDPNQYLKQNSHKKSEENQQNQQNKQTSVDDDPNLTAGTHHVEIDPVSGEKKSHRLSFEIPGTLPSDLEARDEDFKHCRDEVRDRSHEHSVFAGSLGKHQHVYYVLQALNYETMRIREAVSMSSMASLRMSWWRDTVKNALRGQPERQPVIRALSSIGAEYGLKWRHLKPMFEWREKELYWTQPPDIKTLEDYSEGVYGSLMNAYLHCLGIKNIHADHAASHLSKALGLSIMLRATPYHVMLRRSFLPASLMAKHHVSEEMLFRGENNKEVEEVVFEVANQAKQHLDFTRGMHDKVPKEAYPVLYPATMVDTFLDRLQKYNFNIFVQDLQPEKCRLAWTWNYFKTVYIKNKY